jgi:large subunit ribosomal protein L29
MKASELSKRSAPELYTELLKLRKEQFALRLQRATGQAVKPDQFGKVRKNIARIKTVLHAAPRSAVKAADATAAAPAAAKAAPKKAARKSTAKTAKSGVKA